MVEKRFVLGWGIILELLVIMSLSIIYSKALRKPKWKSFLINLITIPIVTTHLKIAMAVLL